MIQERSNPLKPMTVSEILDNTFKIYGKNFLAILLFSAVIGGIFTLIMYFTTQQVMPMDSFFNKWTDMLENPDMDPELVFGPMTEMLPQLFALQGIVMLLSIINAIFIKPFIRGGIINITHNDIVGERFSVQGALSSTLKKFWKLVLTSLSLIPYYIGVGIVFIILTVIFLVPLGLSGVAMSNDATGGRIVGFIFMLLITIAIMVVLAILSGIFIIFTYQTTIIEGNCGFNAMGRSFKLVGKKFWRVLGINLLIYLIIGIIGAILLLISGVTSLVSPSLFMTNYAVGFVMTAFITPILYIATTLLFLDTRARVEGVLEEGIEG